jgi:hypothetical protein
VKARLIPGALALVGLSVAIALNAANGDISADGVLLHMAAVVPNVVVGGIILIRRGGHVVGWIFSLAGLSWGLGIAIEAYIRYGLVERPGSLPSPGMLVSVIEWYWLAYLACLLLLLPQVFPTGKPLPGRFTWGWRATVAWAGSFVILGALESEIEPPGTDLTLHNPIGIPGLGDIEEGAIGAVLFASALILVATSLFALVTRFRRSTGVERQQLKWFTFAGAVLLVGFVSLGALEEVLGGRPPFVDPLLLSAPPICAGVAILRYRLYDIDRLVSRTISYTALTVALASGYFLAVLALQSVLPLADQSPVIVAASTLAVVAAFGPLRSRIRHLVDRRFNRSRYDAEHTIESFAARLRTEVELDALVAGLVTVVDRTMAPAHVSFWVSPGRPS